jgi:isopentenyl-diphosphate delta-isomerase
MATPKRRKPKATVTASRKVASPTASRKQEHLDLCLKRDVASTHTAGWDEVPLPHRALPEISFDNIDLDTRFLGEDFAAPFLVSSMTGGSRAGDALNVRLARFAQQARIPMGVGSQRFAVEARKSGKARDPSASALRKAAPKAVLYANIGIVQFNYGFSVDDAAWLVDTLEARALILHANPLQEAIQAEGDRDFSGLFRRLTEVKKRVTVPIILKETGCGLDLLSCRRAREAGVDAIDVAGLGGTHWGFIEGLRSPNRRALGEIFRNWGIPTAQALSEARALLGPEFPIIASGGVRHGLDAAKAIYLGADLVGMALPFLKAAQEGDKALEDFFKLHCEALKTAFFCTGHTSAAELAASFSGGNAS